METWVSNIVQAVLVAVLVGVTAYYAAQTRRQAQAMRQQLEQLKDQRRKSIQPRLVTEWAALDRKILDLSSLGLGDTVQFELHSTTRNIGMGPATNVTIRAAATIKITDLAGQVSNPTLFFVENYSDFKDRYIQAPGSYRSELRLSAQHLQIDSPAVGTAIIVIAHDDVDGNALVYRKTFSLNKSQADWHLDRQILLPSDSNYPPHLMATLPTDSTRPSCVASIGHDETGKLY